MMETKRKWPKKPGKVIRVSPLVWKTLQGSRRRKESVDSAMRRLLGLPGRKSPTQELREFFALPAAQIIRERVEDARGIAVILAARMKKAGKPAAIEEPIRVREVPQ